MSIYSGFATRQQEEAYNEAVSSVIYILQKRLVKFFRGEAANDVKFFQVLMRIVGSIRNMEEYKYLQPKFSQSIT